jgi:hypothetical protein
MSPKGANPTCPQISFFSHAKTRGVQIGAEFAESFEVLPWLI